jgi:DNA-binding NtrC family response regulator
MHATHPGSNGTALHPAVIRETKPLSDIEREVIVETLHRYNGHRVKTARALGIGVRTLGLKLKKWKELHLVEEGL